MIDFCVLGSGLAGSTIANLLKANYSIQIIDKAKGIGGRASTKKLNKLIKFDHGLQYFSPKSRIFKKFLKKMLKKKILKIWEGKHLDFSLKNKLESEKIIGIKGNNDLNKYLLKKIDVINNQEIIKIIRKKNFWEIHSKNNLYYARNLIITFPYVQSKNLAKKYLPNKLLKLNVKMLPNITLLLKEKRSTLAPFSSIKLNDDIISWISYENSKNRFRSNENYWTLQTSLKYSMKVINKYKKKKSYYSNQIKRKFSNMFGLNNYNLKIFKLHGWKYSFSENKTDLDCYWSSKIGLGICGDWFLGANAESAWLSANKLYSKIKNPPKI